MVRGWKTEERVVDRITECWEGLWKMSPSGTAFPVWLSETEQPLSSLQACYLLGGTQLGILELWGTGQAL